MNYTIAQRMLAAATSAYEVQLNESFTPDPHFYNPLGVHGQPTAFDGGKHEIDAGFFSLIEPERAGQPLDAVLAFRETLGSWEHGSWSSFFTFIDDWLQDDSTRHVPFIIDGKRIGCVAPGFHRALESVWGSDRKCFGNDRLVESGHVVYHRTFQGRSDDFSGGSYD